jgi:uncharacterized protein
LRFIRARDHAGELQPRWQTVSVGARVAKAIANLRGRRVSTGAKGSGSEQIASRLFEILRLNRDSDLSALNLSLSDSIAALRDEKIDAFIFGSASPVDAISRLAQTLPIRFLGSVELAGEMNRRYGRLYAEGEIAPGTYVGQAQAVPPHSASGICW